MIPRIFIIWMRAGMENKLGFRRHLWSKHRFTFFPLAFGRSTIKSRKVASSSLTANLRDQEMATMASRVSGTANFSRRIKTREKCSMQICLDERAQCLKVLRIGSSGREGGCFMPG